MSWTEAWRWLWGAPPVLAEPVADPVHHTIFVVEIEGFASAGRTNMHRLTLRAGLYDVVQGALVGSGVSWLDCYHSDLVDGVLLLVPADYPKAVFSELVPVALTALLAEHNRVHRLPERIRLRVALHAGEVSYDPYREDGSGDRAHVPAVALERGAGRPGECGWGSRGDRFGMVLRGDHPTAEELR